MRRDSRIADIEKMYRFEGQTLQEIGDYYGISRERVRQIMEAHDVNRRHFYSVRLPYGFRMMDYYKYYSNKRDRAFEKIDDTATAYWVGYLLADGTIWRGYICLRTIDKNLLMQFKHFIGCNLPIVESPCNTNWSTKNILWDFRIHCNRMVDDLKQYGVIHGKTHKKRIKNIPEKFISHFVRGFFDGDGCVNVSKPNHYLETWIPSIQVSFTSNKSMLEDIQLILHHLGLVSMTKITQNKTCPKTYALVYSSAVARNILKWMYKDATCFLPRKKRIYDNYVQNYSDKFRIT